MAKHAAHAKKKQKAAGFSTYLRFNLRTFLAFESAYKVLGALFLPATCYGIFISAVKLSGFEYLAQNNFLKFAEHPLCWVAAILCLLIAGIYSMVDISATIYLCECGRQKRKVSIVPVVRFAFANAARVAKPKNWMAIIMVLVVIPLLSIGVTPGIIGTITIPDFIMEFIDYHWYLVILVTAGGIALFVLMIRWLFAFTFFTLEGISFKQACKKSASFGKGHRTRDFASLLFTEARVFVLSFILIVAAVVVLVILTIPAQSFSGLGKALAFAGIGITTTSVILLSLGVNLLSLPICYSVISSRYYRYREEAEDPSPMMDLRIPNEPAPSRIARRIFWSSTALCALAISLISYGIIDGGILNAITKEDVNSIFGTHKTEVVAHRCGAHYAPENTIAALNKASEMGATWCELDVQKCKDGTLIIMHDTNFKRTTGKDAESWELTYDEVKSLDAGSFFGSEYKGEPIPTLEETIQAAKKCGMKLQIEVKPTGHDKGVEEDVVKCVLDNDFQNDCVIASLDYPCLERIHACDPKIKTLYITSMAFGDITKATAATDYSIESTWVNSIMVDDIQRNGSTISAWTVNTKSEMERMVACDVDMLVTDEVETALQVTKNESSGFIAEQIISAFGL